MHVKRHRRWVVEYSNGDVGTYFSPDPMSKKQVIEHLYRDVNCPADHYPIAAYPSKMQPTTPKKVLHHG